ncbi:hypothetical protein CSUI_002666, partial [Cystoisospora suis]
ERQLGDAKRTTAHGVLIVLYEWG